MQAKKSLGQNFLKDKGILKKIANFAQIEKEDVVVEVGPGEGTLTELLLERAKKVIAVEKDERMVEVLQQKFGREIANNKLQIIAGDILKLSKVVFEMPWSQKTTFDNFKLVGNIPYYITGALFKKALESENPPKSITFVIQKEVAERIIARDKKESILSISIKAYGSPEFGGVIKAGSFNPKPKVDSAILSIRKISKENFLRCHLRKFSEGATLGNLEKRFFEILKAGFAHKRKLLLNNLLKPTKPMSRVPFDTSRLKEIFKKCGISEKARAEDLKVEDWFHLAKELL